MELRSQAEQHLARREIVPALETLDEIIVRGEATADDWRLTGNILLSIREYAQAADAYEHGLELGMEDEEACFHLGVSRYQLGDVSGAAAIFQALAERDHTQALFSLATILPGCPEADHESVLAVRRQFARRALAETGDRPWQPPPRTRTGVLRIGYMSAFFDRANYMKPVWGLINGHDRRKFEIRLFADDVKPDGLAWFTPGSQDRVHVTTDLSNDQLLALVREEALDILVDLNGYSVPPRVPLWVHRLAPVGVAWFNMYATSGLPGIDWIIGDESVVRPEEEPFYSERVARLPQSYLSFAINHAAPPVQPPPCISRGGFTFGSLCTQYKLTPAVLDAWSEILRRAPHARLVLGNRTLGKTRNRDYLCAQLAARGIDRGRLEFLPPAKHFEFLQYYDQMDLALDAFPYNGGTTTMEAVWQGVPVLTFDGDRWAARTSKTLLASCHLAEFVADSQQAYIDRAVRWALDPHAPARLAALRRTMRDSLLGSPVCQMGNMVQSMEEIYLKIAQ